MKQETDNHSTGAVANVGGIAVNCLDGEQWCDMLVADWQVRSHRDPPKVVTTANGQVISLFSTCSDFSRAMGQADAVAADGMSIVKSSKRYCSRAVPERVATTDWFDNAARVSAEVGISFYLIGATDTVIQKAVENALKVHPTLRIVGYRNGYFRDEEVSEIAKQVDESGADVLWLGIGNPRQLIVAHMFKASLKNVTWVRTCGGLFDHLAGVHQRAPRFVQQLGFEWAWRVAMEPRRLFWRYLTTNVHAAYLMYRNSK